MNSKPTSHILFDTAATYIKPAVQHPSYFHFRFHVLVRPRCQENSISLHPKAGVAQSHLLCLNIGGVARMLLLLLLRLLLLRLVIESSRCQQRFRRR